MSWQKQTHEKRLDRFEQRLLSVKFDSKIITCRSRAVESRVSGAGEGEDKDQNDSILSLIEDLARRIDGLERMTTNLSEELLLENRQIQRMRSLGTIASVLFLSSMLIAGAWVKYTAVRTDAIPRTSDDHRDSARSGHATYPWRGLK